VRRQGVVRGHPRHGRTRRRLPGNITTKYQHSIPPGFTAVLLICYLHISY
jgi:hypothetical protein